MEKQQILVKNVPEDYIRVTSALGEQSPIDGYVMATTRPLKGQKLPGLADLDRLLSSLQKNVVTVTIHNTMGEPRVKVVPFAQVQTALKGLLWNQLNNRQ